MAKTSENGYIPSIDGLRAVAVLAVLLFHVDLETASGGFAGVDLFFVISGFLITRNIATDLRNGEWSFSRFYIRRIARLFPALFVTIALTLIAGWWLLSPNELERLGQSAIAATISISNVFFWSEVGYFDAASTTKPLLHTWSLSVEEQFYLVWPVTLVLLTAVSRTLKIAIVLAIAIISAAAAFLFLPWDPSSVFYLAPFRIHQFAVGAVIALVGWHSSQKIASVFTAFALFGFACVVVFVSDSSPYLYGAILPSLLAGAIILTSRSWLSGKILGSPVAVWLGRRSYSIYLAHWPIIVFWKLATDLTFSTVEQILACIISIVSGIVLFEVVERRFRFSPSHAFPRKARAIVVSAALGVSTLIIGSLFWTQNGFPKRFSSEIIAAIDGADDLWTARQVAVKEGICSHVVTSASAEKYDPRQCSAPPDSGQSYLVIGDSFANDTLLVLRSAYPEIYFGQIAVPGCLLRLPKQFAPDEQIECRKLYELGLTKLIENQNYDGIILASNWQKGHYYRINDIINALGWRELDIVVIGQRVRFKDRVPEIVARSDSLSSAEAEANALIRELELEINSTIVERFAGRVKVIDFMALSCPDLCDIFDEDGELMYMDDSHFSFAGIEVIANRLKKVRPNL